MAMIEGFDPPLSKGMLRSFVAKLENALKDFEAGNTEDARDKLTAFINHARAQRGKALTADRADEMIAAARAIIAQLDEAMTIPLIEEEAPTGK